jgi:hypothetical protein
MIFVSILGDFKMNKINKWPGIVSISLALFLASVRSDATVMYQIAIDTSTLNRALGFIDLQFNPGALDAPELMAALSNIFTDGALNTTSEVLGGASGVLPGSNVTITNSDGFNDLFQGITFGNMIRFIVAFSGPGIELPSTSSISGSVFAISLYEMTGTLPLLTTSLDGSLLHIDIRPNGSTSLIAFPDDEGTFRGVGARLSTPEPGTLATLLIGLVAYATLSPWQRKHLLARDRLA